MLQSDVDAVMDIVFAAGVERPGPERFTHPVRTDPEGAWVAEDENGIVGVGCALLREDLWVLTQLAVRPDLQSSGIGSALLRRAWEYGAGAKGRLIASSPDPRALRAYSRLGLDLHPCFKAEGVPRGLEAAPGIREGDLAFTREVDRHLRGAAHGPDIEALLNLGCTLWRNERAYAVVGPNGSPRLLAAFDEGAARELLTGVLARADHATVNWITGRQQWAIDVCLQARLDLSLDAGAIFIGGEVGPMAPYLPNGAFL